MNRRTRILLNLLLPSLVAAGLVISVILATGDGVLRMDSLMASILSILLVVGIAYLYGIVPSALHAFIMECAYRRWPASSQTAISISVASGSASGLLSMFVASVFVGRLVSDGVTAIFFIFGFLGAVIGLIVGVIIWLLARRRRAAGEKSMPCISAN